MRDKSMKSKHVKRLVHIFNGDVPIKNAECISIQHETFQASGFGEYMS